MEYLNAAGDALADPPARYAGGLGQNVHRHLMGPAPAVPMQGPPHTEGLSIEVVHPGHLSRSVTAALVKTRLKRMQYRPRLIESLIAKTGLDLQPP